MATVTEKHETEFSKLFENGSDWILQNFAINHVLKLDNHNTVNQTMSC